MKHKPEPWSIDDSLQILDDQGDVLALMCLPFSRATKAEQETINRHNAERLVECVNACSGIPSASLKKIVRLGIKSLKKD